MGAGVSLSLSRDGIHGECICSSSFSLISDPFPRELGFYVVSVPFSWEQVYYGGICSPDIQEVDGDSRSIPRYGSLLMVYVPFSREYFSGGNTLPDIRAAIGGTGWSTEASRVASWADLQDLVQNTVLGSIGSPRTSSLAQNTDLGSASVLCKCSLVRRMVRGFAVGRNTHIPVPITALIWAFPRFYIFLTPQGQSLFGSCRKGVALAHGKWCSASARFVSGISDTHASNVACGYSFGSPDPFDMANGGRYFGSQVNGKTTVTETVWCVDDQTTQRLGIWVPFLSESGDRRADIGERRSESGFPIVGVPDLNHEVLIWSCAEGRGAVVRGNKEVGSKRGYVVVDLGMSEAQVTIGALARFQIDAAPLRSTENLVQRLPFSFFMVKDLLGKLGKGFRSSNFPRQAYMRRRRRCKGLVHGWFLGHNVYPIQHGEQLSVTVDDALIS